MFGAALGIPARIFSAGLRVCGRYRPLQDHERVEAERVFGHAIDLDRVRITDKGWLTGLVMRCNGHRAFTVMHTIHCCPKRGIWLGTLIHELVHVWQSQHYGQRYMLEALHAQFLGEGYTVTDAHLARWNGDFEAPNREQQAVLVERYWLHRWGGGFDDWEPYACYAERVWAEAG